MIIVMIIDRSAAVLSCSLNAYFLIGRSTNMSVLCEYEKFGD